VAKAKFDIKTEYTRSLYAYVGVADLAVEAVRDYFAKAVDVQKEVATKVADLDYKPAALREQAVTVVNARVDALSAEAKARRAKIEAKVNDTYAELAERGERLVGRIRRQESTKATVKSADITTAKAKTTRTQATKAAESTAKDTKTAAKRATKSTSTAAKRNTSSATSSAKATATAAKKTASNAADAAGDAAKKIGD
jgi:hypothetical protein